VVLTANDSFIRTKIKGKMVVVTGKFIKTISEIVMHAKPYKNVAEINEMAAPQCVSLKKMHRCAVHADYQYTFA
jgi:hypothetical protein